MIRLTPKYFVFLCIHFFKTEINFKKRQWNLSGSEIMVKVAEALWKLWTIRMTVKTIPAVSRPPHGVTWMLTNTPCSGGARGVFLLVLQWVWVMQWWCWGMYCMDAWRSKVRFKHYVNASVDSQATATDRCNIEVNCDSVNSIGDNMNHAPIPQSASNACFSTEKHNTNPQCPLLFALHRETMPKDTLLFTVLKSNKANNRCKALTEVGQLVIWPCNTSINLATEFKTKINRITAWKSKQNQ